MPDASTPPDARLLLTSQCPHCPSVLAALSEMVKQGRIGRLEAVNIEIHPDTARELGVRGVPWIRIGEFELQGLHSRAELETWAERAGSDAGLADYYNEQLKTGQLEAVVSAVEKTPQHLNALLRLVEEPEIDLGVRIGISAVMEAFAGKPALQNALPRLIELAQHEDPRVRADIAHFLALSASDAALPPLRKLTEDDQASVSEVATDSLEELQERLASGGT